jgi:hypothetical protein
MVSRIRSGKKVLKGKLCIIPKPGDEGLEGKIRLVFSGDIIEKLGTDGYLYIKMEENDPNQILVEKLSREYPRLVLMNSTNWSRISTIN